MPTFGRPDHRQFRSPETFRGGGFLVFVLIGEGFNDCVHQCRDPASVKGGDAYRAGEAQRVKFRLGKFRRQAFGLVDCDDDRFPADPNPGRYVFVGGGQAFVVVDDEDHRVGLVHGGLGLAGGP